MFIFTHCDGNNDNDVSNEILCSLSTICFSIFLLTLVTHELKNKRIHFIIMLIVIYYSITYSTLNTLCPRISVYFADFKSISGSVFRHFLMLWNVMIFCKLSITVSISDHVREQDTL